MKIIVNKTLHVHDEMKVQESVVCWTISDRLHNWRSSPFPTPTKINIEIR